MSYLYFISPFTKRRKLAIWVCHLVAWLESNRSWLNVLQALYTCWKSVVAPFSSNIDAQRHSLPSMLHIQGLRALYTINHDAFMTAKGISHKGNLPEIQIKQMMTYFRNLKWTFFDIASDSFLQNDPLYHYLHNIPQIPCAASRMGSTPNIHHSLGPSFSPGKERHCKSWTPSLRVKHRLICPSIRSSLPRWFNDWFASNELMWFATTASASKIRLQIWNIQFSLYLPSTYMESMRVRIEILLSEPFIIRRCQQNIWCPGCYRNWFAPRYRQPTFAAAACTLPVILILSV